MEASHVDGTPSDSASRVPDARPRRRVVWIRDDAVLVRITTGRERWHGVLSDITEQKQAEAELEPQRRSAGRGGRLGEHALGGARPPELMQEAVGCAAELLEVEIAGVLELIPDDGLLSCCAPASAGRHGSVGIRSPLGRDSQAGYTILSRGPRSSSPTGHAETRFEQSGR